MFFLVKNIKWIGLAALILILVGFGWYIKSVIDQNASLKIEMKQKQQQISEITKTLSEVQNSIEIQNKELSALSRNLSEVRLEAKEAVQVFNRHNLAALSAAKPGLIEKRVNKATQKVFMVIQSETQQFAQEVK